MARLLGRQREEAPRGDPGGAPLTGTLSFAFVAGTVATVNPCGFALLPAYLARRLGTDGGDRAPGVEVTARALAVGAVTSFGFVLVFGSVGAAISLGAHWLAGWLPWAGLVIGVALASTGLAVLAGRHVGLRLPGARGRPGGGLRGDLLFGIGYGTASLSCTLPIFLAATGTALTGSLLGSVLSFLAYAAGMGTILTALAVAAALSRSGLARAIRRILPYLDRISGAFLFLAGGYVVYYWAFYLWPGSTTRQSGVIAQGELLSARLGAWLGAGTGQTVVEALLAAVALLLLWVTWRRRSRRIGSARQNDASTQLLEERTLL